MEGGWRAQSPALGGPGPNPARRAEGAGGTSAGRCRGAGGGSVGYDGRSCGEVTLSLPRRREIWLHGWRTAAASAASPARRAGAPPLPSPGGCGAARFPPEDWLQRGVRTPIGVKCGLPGGPQASDWTSVPRLQRPLSRLPAGEPSRQVICAFPNLPAPKPHLLETYVQDPKSLTGAAGWASYTSHAPPG